MFRFQSRTHNRYSCFHHVDVHGSESIEFIFSRLQSMLQSVVVD